MLPIALPGLNLQACPQRALWWPAQRCLLLADVHLGKADTFRHFGISVPQGVQQADITRLSQVLALLQPARCVVLGDLVHGQVLGTQTVQLWNSLVQHYPHTCFELVVGNHDRALPTGVLELHAVHTTLELAGVWLTHEPLPVGPLLAQGTINIHGHIHPAVRVPGSARKLPALVYQPPYVQLPAFSGFTAGVAAPARCEGLWAFVDEAQQVVRLR